MMVLDGSPSFQDEELLPSLKGGVAIQNGRLDAQGPSKTAGTILKVYERACMSSPRGV